MRRVSAALRCASSASLQRRVSSLSCSDELCHCPATSFAIFSAWRINVFRRRPATMCSVGVLLFVSAAAHVASVLQRRALPFAQGGALLLSLLWRVSSLPGNGVLSLGPTTCFTAVTAVVCFSTVLQRRVLSPFSDLLSHWFRIGRPHLGRALSRFNGELNFDRAAAMCFTAAVSLTNAYFPSKSTV